MSIKKRILFIDDDEFLGGILTQKIQSDGYDVMLVRDGAEGLRQMTLFKPDLIILDILLPTMNGYEILEAKQKDLTVVGIPVIIVSNSGQPVEIDRALALGVKDYLIKTQIDPDEVLEKVHTYLGKNQVDSSKTINKDLAQQRLAKKKILLVEDDQFLSNILCTKLNHEGCVGLYAKNGEDALEILTREVPDIILLDLLLPGISGFDVLKAIGANPTMSHVPVMVLSNLGQKEDIEMCKNLGATKYLIKAEHDLDDIVIEIVKVLEEKL